MGPIWYRVRREMRAHWKRAITLSVVVAVVGALVLTLAAGVLRTLSAPDRYSEALGTAYDVSLEQESGPVLTDELLALPAVADVETATFVFGGLVAEGEEQPVDGFVFAGSIRAFGAQVREGRAPDPAEPGEFVANRNWTAMTGAEVGDELQVLTLTQEQADERGFEVTEPEGPTLTGTLIGVIDGPSDLEDETPLTLFPPALLEEGDVGVASSVGVVALNPGSTVEELRAQLDTVPGGETIGLDSFDWIDDEIRAGVRAQGQGLAVVAAMVAIAAVAVTGQLVSRQVRLAADQRRAMSAMGLTRAQVLADPLGATAMPIAVGALGAAGLAAALSGVFPTGFVRRIEPDPGPMLDPLAHGLGAVLFAALLVIWVLLALLLGGRETRAPHRSGMVDRLTGRLPPGPAVTGVRFALTRHPRDAGSVRAPLLGLVLVLSVLIGALTFGISVERFLDEPARHGSNFDFATGAGEQEVPEEIRALLEEDPDVEDLTLYGTQFGNVGSRRIYVTGMQQVRGDLEPDILSGRLAREPDEIVLGRVDARKLSVEVGDELVVGGADDTATFQITGLAVIPSIEGGDGVGKGAIVTLEGLRRLDADATLGAAAVRLRPGATDAADRLGEAMGFPVGRPDPPATVQNMERARGTPFIVAGSLAALALLSMSHQLITSARRRRRDLAVLRAIGADRRWVTSVLHWQVTALAAVVVALATPLGIAAGRLVYQAYIDRIGARTDVSVPFALLAAIALGLLVLGNVGAMWPARRVRHERPARVLSDE